MTHNIGIRSGGQTGADRGALDAALAINVECHGWCPEGRQAEDGRIPDRYPVVELKGAGYRQRTLRNVTDSDGTVIIYFGVPTGGTEQTLAFCIKEKTPYLLIDATELSMERAAERIEGFVHKYSIDDLNVAGPRAGGEPMAYSYAFDVIGKFLRSDVGTQPTA